MTAPVVAHRCAVLGSPVAHSLSPVIHHTAYGILGLTDWRYEAHDVTEATLGAFIKGCGPEWVGLSCTMPLKVAVLGFGVPSSRARLLNAGNTYLFGGDGRGARVENTDVDGVLGPLRGAGVTAARSALLVGAGATARSALCALAELGVRDVLVVARDAGRAHASLDAVAAALGQTVDVRPWAVPDTAAVDVLVSSVPAELDAALVAGLVARSRVVFDLIYGHGPSRYGPDAAAAGVPLLDGLDMLVGQAVGQLRLMTGRDCPPGPLLAAARAELARRAG